MLHCRLLCHEHAISLETSHFSPPPPRDSTNAGANPTDIVDLPMLGITGDLTQAFLTLIDTEVRKI